MSGNRELHYRYAISYLVCVIILIISIRYYDVPNLVDKFSFALTLASIFLALIAIFYSFVSEQKQDIQHERLMSTNANLDRTAGEIRSVVQEISRFVDEAPRQFTQLNEKLDKFSQVAAGQVVGQPEASKAERGVEKSPLLKLNEVIFKGIFLELRFASMAALYLFVKSLERDKEITRDDAQEFLSSGFDYCVGILNGFEIFGLLKFKIIDKNIIPIECDEIISKNIEPNLRATISSLAGEDKKVLSRMIEIIDHKFSGKLGS